MKTEIRAKRGRYIFEIDHKLRDEFEAACALRGKKRVDVMIQFIRAYVDGDKDILNALKKKYQIAKDGE